MNSFACRITSLVGHAPDVATSLAFQGSPALCRVFISESASALSSPLRRGISSAAS